MSRTDAGPLLLHLGSGTTAPATWMNVDNSWNALLSKLPGVLEQPARSALAVVLGDTLRIRWPRNVVVRDLCRRLPLADSSVSAVYASHVLEHLERAEAGQLLAECHRVLAPGALLRVVTPDLEQLARTYLDAKSSSPTAADAFVESWNVFHPHPRSPLMRWYRRARPLHSHKWLYDAQSLRCSMGDVGFRDLRRCGYLDSAIPLERLREVEAESRFTDSLCLEARR